MTEFLFILIITTLLGKVFELVNDKQQMQLENEKLRSENLQNRYDVLLNQINPHFFFNSLNSLASLVRDGRSDNALRYIDELSDTFRYAMRSSGREMVTVAEELESLNAYNYLLHIRFEDKLFIETNIEEEALTMLIPVLSLQPLIENVVKHNVISTDAPLTITITGNQDCISVINPLRPRTVTEGKSGTGVKVRDLLTGKTREVRSDLVINCGGTWADKILSLATGSSSAAHKVKRSEGIHIITKKIAGHHVVSLQKEEGVRPGVYIFMRSRPYLQQLLPCHCRLEGVGHDAQIHQRITHIGA